MIPSLLLPVLINGEYRIVTSWTFDPDFPLAVTMTSPSGDGETVEWTIGRALLSAAWATGEAGWCDVRIYSADGATSMHLTAPEGEARIEFDTELLASWINDTYDLVDVDQEADKLTRLIDRALTDINTEAGS